MSRKELRYLELDRQLDELEDQMEGIKETMRTLKYFDANMRVIQ